MPTCLRLRMSASLSTIATKGSRTYLARALYIGPQRNHHLPCGDQRFVVCGDRCCNTFNPLRHFRVAEHVSWVCSIFATSFLPIPLNAHEQHHRQYCASVSIHERAPNGCCFDGGKGGGGERERERERKQTKSGGHLR